MEWRSVLGYAKSTASTAGALHYLTRLSILSGCGGFSGSAMPPTPTHSRNFSTFSRSRSTFSSRTARQIFSKSRSGRRDRFGQKIVKIGAILAIFGPFEIFRSFAVIFWPSTSGCDGSYQFLRAAGAPVRRRGAAGAPAARKN